MPRRVLAVLRSCAISRMFSSSEYSMRVFPCILGGVSIRLEASCRWYHGIAAIREPALRPPRDAPETIRCGRLADVGVWPRGRCCARRHHTTRSTTSRLTPRQPARRPSPEAHRSGSGHRENLSKTASGAHTRLPRRAVSDPDRSLDAYGVGFYPAVNSKKGINISTLRRY